MAIKGATPDRLVELVVVALLSVDLDAGVLQRSGSRPGPLGAKPSYARCEAVARIAFSPLSDEVSRKKSLSPKTNRLNICYVYATCGV